MVCVHRETSNSLNYNLYKMTMSVSPSELSDIIRFAKRGECIANPDRKRRQNKLPLDNIVVQRFLSALHQVGELEGRWCNDVATLHSEAGCKEQRAHSDFAPQCVRELKGRKPATAMCALEAGSKVKIEGREVDLPVNSILVFEGDVIHAGSAYVHENTRLHAYLEVDEYQPPREHNYTWFKV